MNQQNAFAIEKKKKQIKTKLVIFLLQLKQKFAWRSDRKPTQDEIKTWQANV